MKFIKLSFMTALSATLFMMMLTGAGLLPVGGGGATGDISVPGSSVDNEIARFDGTTGKIIQGGGNVFISDAGDVGIGTGSPNSKLDVRGSFAVLRLATAVSSSSADEVIIGVTDTTAPRTITISSADVVAGRLFIIKDESGGAAANNITIATAGAETIDGAASVTIISNYGAIKLYSNGTDLFTW